MYASVSKQIGMLKRLKDLIILSTIIPHLTYCYCTLIVWHFSHACDWRKLERLQERAL